MKSALTIMTLKMSYHATYNEYHLRLFLSGELMDNEKSLPKLATMAHQLLCVYYSLKCRQGTSLQRCWKLV
jgi:hypothetical protein